MKNLKRNYATACGDERPSPDLLVRQGLAHHGEGRLADALAQYERALALAPDTVDALLLSGLALVALGEPAPAAVRIERAARLAPNPIAFAGLGNARLAAGDILGAVEAYEESVRLDPKDADAHYNLANARLRAGALDEALDGYAEALRRKPDHLPARFNRANALAAAERHAEAIDGYRRIAATSPGFPSLWTNLGVSLVRLEALEDAARAFETAVRLNAEDAQAHNNLGCVLGRLGRFEDALPSLRRAVALVPDDVEARLNLARGLQRANLLEAVSVAADAVRRTPHDAQTWRTLGDARTSFGEAEAALRDYARAHAIDPEWSLKDTNAYGLALSNSGRIDESAAFLDRYLEAWPEDVQAWGNLAVVHATAGFLDDSLACFDRALAIGKDALEAHSNRLVIMSYGEDATPATMFAEARRWAARNVPDKPRFPAQPSHRHDRLRVGYVSGDFRQHPVGRFVAQILAAHDRERFEITAYSNFWAEDEVTREIRSGVDHWRKVVGLPDERFAERVHEDEIDLLIDLTGHTPMHRLTAFARRLAPVQATWLGYFGTTGIDEMDFILSDRILLPETEEEFYTERPARMPSGLYRIQKPNLPIEPSSPPALANGYVTFGCFNMTTKITPGTIALWSEVLRALPDARMVINPHGIVSNRMHERFYGLFAEHGIEKERVDFWATKGRQAYFEAFQKIDVVLDTTPFGGGTTTSEALWMGVPVIALSTARFPGRMTESVLDTIGIPEMMPRSREGYVRMAVDLAGDLPRLAELRSTLRSKVEGSRLCDVSAYTRELESTFEWMWANRKA